MTSRKILTASLLVAYPCFLFSFEAWSQNRNEAAATKAEAAGEGWLLNMDEEMFPPPGTTGQHFHQARADILNGSHQSGRDEIKKATTYLMMQLGRATDAGKRLLNASIRELRHFAEVVGRSESNYYELQSRGFEQIFGKSELALAKHHQLNAAQAWNRKDPQATGHDLQAATVHLKQAWSWLRDGFDAAQREAIRDTGRAGLVLTREELVEADSTAAALIEGSGWTDAQVNSALDNLGNEIARLKAMVGKGQEATANSPRSRPLGPKNLK